MGPGSWILLFLETHWLKMRLSLYLCFLVILLSVCSTVAQPDTTRRPKIGLALSGGGAKGFAHLGLLKVLEEVGIRPDYITGTSMGSILGGLYAIGYSAGELEAISRALDWSNTFSNKVDLRLINVLQKENYGTHLVTLEYDKGKFRFGQGLINGQQLDLMLTRLARPAYQHQVFDEFPIPFRCVAVDVLTGNIVTLKNGFLAEAQRASMAIPVVFAPVAMDDYLLVDGGVIRNFPVQEVIDMGADIVIGAYTGRNNLEMEDVHSMIDILVQTNFLYGIKDSEEQAAKCDIYLDLSGDFAATEFDKAGEIIAVGEKRTREHIESLNALAAQLRKFEPQGDRKRLDFPDSLDIEEVSMTKISPATRPLVQRFIDVDPGKKYSFSSIESKFYRLYGTQMFEKTSYGLAPGQDGKTILQVEAEEKAPLSLDFGLHYNNPDKAGIVLKGRLNNLLGKAAVLEGRLKIAETPAVHAAFFQYVGPQRRFLYMLGLNFHKTDQFYRPPSQEIYRKYDADNFAGFGKLIWNFDNNFGVAFKYQVNFFHINSPVAGERSLVDFDQRNREFGLEWKLNTTNSNYFPDKGLKMDLTLGYHHNNVYSDKYGSPDAIPFPDYLKSRHYLKANLFAEWYFSIAPRITLQPKFAIGLKSQPGFADNYFLGGDYFYRQSGMPFIGLREFRRSYRQTAVMQLGLRWMAIRKFYLTPKVNFARVQHPEGLSQDASSIENIWGAGLSLGYDSFIGPMAIGIGSSSIQDGLRVSVDFGYRFVF